MEKHVSLLKQITPAIILLVLATTLFLYVSPIKESQEIIRDTVFGIYKIRIHGLFQTIPKEQEIKERKIFTPKILLLETFLIFVYTLVVFKIDNSYHKRKSLNT